MGPRGAVSKEDLSDDPEGSQGFCLLNNAAIGAAYARCTYRHRCKRVAIVDFDVHHGNGTEACVRNVCLNPYQPRRQAAPTLEAFAGIPGGDRLQVQYRRGESPKPWLDITTDPANVFFASVHGYGDGFYPGSGKNLVSKSSEVGGRGAKREGENG